MDKNSSAHHYYHEKSVRTQLIDEIIMLLFKLNERKLKIVFAFLQGLKN